MSARLAPQILPQTSIFSVSAPGLRDVLRWSAPHFPHQTPMCKSYCLTLTDLLEMQSFVHCVQTSQQFPGRCLRYDTSASTCGSSPMLTSGRVTFTSEGRLNSWCDPCSRCPELLCTPWSIFSAYFFIKSTTDRARDEVVPTQDTSRSLSPTLKCATVTRQTMHRMIARNTPGLIVVPDLSEPETFLLLK